MVPKDDVLMVALGLLKFVRLSRPNVSKRNWNLRRSLMGKFLNTETLAVCEPGPKKVGRVWRQCDPCQRHNHANYGHQLHRRNQFGVEFDGPVKKQLG